MGRLEIEDHRITSHWKRKYFEELLMNLAFDKLFAAPKQLVMQLVFIQQAIDSETNLGSYAGSPARSSDLRSPRDQPRSIMRSRPISGVRITQYARNGRAQASL